MLVFPAIIPVHQHLIYTLKKSIRYEITGGSEIEIHIRNITRLILFLITIDVYKWRK